MTAFSSAWKSNASWQSGQPTRWARMSSNSCGDSSPSRNVSSSLSVSLQSAMVGFVAPAAASCLPGEPAGVWKVVQRLLHRLSSPVEAGHHAADRHVEHLGDLL